MKLNTSKIIPHLELLSALLLFEDVEEEVSGWFMVNLLGLLPPPLLLKSPKSCCC